MMYKTIFQRLFFLLFMLIACSNSVTNSENQKETIVEHFGQLKVSGKNIVDQNNDIIVLRGMSLFWSQWGGSYYNKETIKWLRDDWKCTIIRAPLGVENGGYLENKSLERYKLFKVIDACIELGIYVIVDWHDHHGENNVNEAIEFFKIISVKYGKYPNIIYEIYNEPLQISWDDVLKPYTDSLVNAIRENDPDNIIIAGTPTWSQDVETVIENRSNDPNVVYSLHFYTGTHTQYLRDKANLAIAANVPLFVSEWGLSEANGTGPIDMAESELWFNYMEENNLSWCNWSIINKDESSGALLAPTTSLSGWSEEEISQSGNKIRNYLISNNEAMFEALK